MALYPRTWIPDFGIVVWGSCLSIAGEVFQYLYYFEIPWCCFLVFEPFHIACLALDSSDEDAGSGCLDLGPRFSIPSFLFLLLGFWFWPV